MGTSLISSRALSSTELFIRFWAPKDSVQLPCRIKAKYSLMADKGLQHPAPAYLLRFILCYSRLAHFLPIQIHFLSNSTQCQVFPPQETFCPFAQEFIHSLLPGLSLCGWLCFNGPSSRSLLQSPSYSWSIFLFSCVFFTAAIIEVTFVFLYGLFIVT